VSYRSIAIADKLYVNAKDAYLNGDEEKAYVYYMRYYYVLKNIWKDPSYKSKKVCLYRCVCVCACLHVFVQLCTCVYAYIFCKHLNKHLCNVSMPQCMCIWNARVCVCLCVCVCVRARAYMYTCACVCSVLCMCSVDACIEHLPPHFLIV